MIRLYVLITLLNIILFIDIHSIIANDMCLYDDIVRINSNKVNLRKGPSLEYPIISTYIKKNVPLKIISCYEDWLFVVDYENMTGWLKKKFVTKNIEYVIVTENKTIIFCRPDILSKKKYITNKGLILKYKSCNEYWCKIKLDKKIYGWIEKKNIWGLNKH